MTIGNRTPAAVGFGNNANVTPALPSGVSAGDLLLAFAFDGSTTAITPPSGYQTYATRRSGACFFGGKVAGSSESAPTFNFNSSGLENAAFVLALTGAYPLSSVTDLANYGDLNSSTSVTTTQSTGIPYGNLAVPQDNSLILLVGWNSSGVTPNNSAMVAAGWTALEAIATGPYTGSKVYAYSNLQTTKANVAAGTIPCTGSGTVLSCVFSIAIPIAVPLANITSVGAITNGSSFTVTGNGFSASGNAVTINGVAQTITAQSTTSITCTAVLGSNMYGVAYPLVVTPSGGSGIAYGTNVAIAPASTVKYVTLIGPLVPSSQRISATPDLAPGDQLELSNVTGGFALTDVNIYSDGEWIATPGQYSFDVRANDGTGWGAVGTQAIGIAPPVITADPANDTVLQGATATFNVITSGTVTGYQWYKNGSSISGATAQSYTTPATASTDNGATFYCVVSNSGGSVQSAAAVLTVVSAVLPLNDDVWDGNLPGLMPNRTRAYIWKTAIQEALSGKESRVQLMQYPRVQFGLTYEMLRDTITPSELKAIVGLFNAAGGQFDTFLYRDPDFNHVTLEKIGTGDGSTTAFQLIASFQNSGSVGSPELIQNLNGTPQIYLNGVLVSTSNYAIGPTGIVTFTTAPAAGADLRWTGDFYYRVRFTDDTLEMTQFMNSWWQSKQIVLKSIKL